MTSIGGGFELYSAVSRLGADWDSSSGQESDVNPGQSSSVVYVLVRES